MKAKYKIRKSRRKFKQLIEQQLKEELGKPITNENKKINLNDIDFEEDRRKLRLK